MTAILTYAKSALLWLQRGSPDIPEAITCLQQIVANGRRASAVIAQIRSLAAKVGTQPEPLDISQLVEESLHWVQREARMAQVKVTCVPAPAGTVLADRVQIQQVIVNLAMNGIQAMDGVAGRLRELRVTCQSDGQGMVKVAVEDRGTGIRCDPSRLFEPFFSTKPGGMGLGLAICRSIVNAHGGRMGSVNNADCGATVFFTIPAEGVGLCERLSR